MMYPLLLLECNGWYLFMGCNDVSTTGTLYCLLNVMMFQLLFIGCNDVSTIVLLDVMMYPLLFLEFNHSTIIIAFYQYYFVVCSESVHVSECIMKVYGWSVEKTFEVYCFLYENHVICNIVNYKLRKRALDVAKSWWTQDHSVARHFCSHSGQSALSYAMLT